MKALALVLAFWALVGVVVGWSVAIAWATVHALPLAVFLGAVPVVALSAFLWFAFSEMLGSW